MQPVIHTKISEGRRVAIPAELCHRYGLHPGDPVVLEPSDAGIVVQPLDAVIREVQAYFADIAPPGVLLSRRCSATAGRKQHRKTVANAVLDARRLIAFIRNEPARARVAVVLAGACISAVNLAETIAKMVAYGKPVDDTVHQIERLRITVLPFDANHAQTSASLWKSTRRPGTLAG